MAASKNSIDVWAVPPGLRRAYAPCRFGQLHYRIAAPSAPRFPPLLVFHQTPTSGRCYEGLIGEMGRDRVAIAVDTPGFGASDPPSHAPSIADYAGAMGDLIDALSLPQVDVFGDHTGAKIAVECALQNPERVRRVVLNAAPVYAAAELDALQQQDVAVERFGGDGEHILARWAWAMHQRGADTPLDAVLLEVAESLRAGAHVWHGHHAAFGYQHRDALPRVSQPVLILHAQDDLWAPTARARPFIRNGRMVDLPEWGREMLLVRFQAVAPILREFLDAD
ncbi:MAG: alpha/beta fold hydrolase [Proteobacteria bacterium]|nr:alpha/beta fold hydrolase [Pseudomonadota bacterium]MDA1057199.1 alpha/beta fold hydrolase [Pseudomonadota bacterium]